MEKKTVGLVLTILGAVLTAAGTIVKNIDLCERTDEEVHKQVNERLDLLEKKED